MPILNKLTKPQWLFNLCNVRKLTMNKTSRFQYVFIPYSVLLTYLLLSPDPLFFLPDGDESVKTTVHKSLPDYVHHAIAWAIFTLLFEFSTSKSVAFIYLASITYSAILEFAQPLFGRVTELSDFIANAIGITLAISLPSILRSSKNSSKASVDPE